MPALFLAAAISILLPSGLLAADPSAGPGADASPVATMTPAEALCDGVADLEFIIGFLRETDVDADGWLPVLVGAIAGLSEARELIGPVGETYRPLVEDLIASLEGLRLTVEEFRDIETTGARIAVIGEAITDIGNAMDALSIQVRTPCPSAAPSPSPP